MKKIPITRGFTLVETMIAVTILALAIAGPLYTASRSVIAAQNASAQLTATYLAQEGIEYVRMMRDNEYLAVSNQPNASVQAWSNFLSSPDAASIVSCRATTCTLDPSRPMGTGSGFSLQPCSLSGSPYPVCAPLNLSNGIYTQQSLGTPTIFTRTIQAVDASSQVESISSIVSWTYHGTVYSVSAADQLTPWQ